MPEIILQHVTKRFDKFVAVQDLDLQIQDRVHKVYRLSYISIGSFWMATAISPGRGALRADGPVREPGEGDHP